VGRVQRPGEAGVPALREQVAVGLAELGVGQQHRDRGVHQLERVLGGRWRFLVREQRPPVGPEHVAPRVHHRHRDQRGRPRRAAGHPDAARVDPAAPLAGRRARAGPDRTGGELLPGQRGYRGPAAADRVGRGAAHRGVEDRHADHDRHRAERGREADPELAQQAGHAVAGGQSEGGPAGQHDGVHPVDRAGRVEQGELAGGRGSPAHLAGADRARRREDDRDPGPGAGPVTGPGRQQLRFAHPDS
jgi:hypothetical protein